VTGNRNASASAPIRVLLADDHTMFRQGLAGVLASYGGMEVVAEVPNDGEALETARDLDPEVVVMQVQMPFERAVETLGAMRSFERPPKVVIVTMFESPRYVRALTGWGPAPTCSRAPPPTTWWPPSGRPSSIPVARTSWWGCPGRCWRAPGRARTASSRPGSWSSCCLAARGLSNERIASSLHLSERTVKRHLANVYIKMGVHSRGQASKEALLRDWITIEEITAEDTPGEGV
jgi:DNA-binding NarL/FixJ family response regulator